MNFSKVASRPLARDRTRRWDFRPYRANAHPPGKGGNLLLRTACAVPETEEPQSCSLFPTSGGYPKATMAQGRAPEGIVG